MKIEFQNDLIKYLVQRKEARKYIQAVGSELFDSHVTKAVFDLLQSFDERYNSQPSIGNLMEFFDRELKQSDSKLDLSDVSEEIGKEIKNIYKPFSANTNQIREIIIQEYQSKLMRDLFIEKSADLKTGNKETITDVFNSVSDIKRIGDNDFEEEDNRGIFALAEYGKAGRTITEGVPTYLKDLNKMTTAGGFHPPQLITFMGAPKSFKTGTLLNLAMNYVRDGKKVYYVDCENGENIILDRFYQSMLECTWSDYASGELDKTLEEIVKRFKTMGGDFKADFYPANSNTIADVEAELEHLKLEHGWEPDIVCYDYLDLMRPNDRKIIEKRLQIQAVYFDAIKLQKKLDMIGIGLSQVSKKAVGKRQIRMEDFAEDFGKAANTHAAFALCRTVEEAEAGVMRITPVVQRQGVGADSGMACFISINEAKMSLKEIRMEDWKAVVAEAEKGHDKTPRMEQLKDR